jgi:hypothetical protein
MKRPALYFLLFSVFASIGRETKAQETLNAMTLNSGPIEGSPRAIQGEPPPYSQFVIIVGSQGGDGWTFTPTENLLVTAIDSFSGTQISFWQGTNQILQSFDYTGTTYSFQPIAPLLLSAGQNYSISTQNPDFTSTVDFVLDGDFSSSPYLADIGNYTLSPSGQWSAFPSDAMDIVLIGPNFQFQVVPPPMLNISASTDILTLSWVTPSTNYVLQENSDLTTTNWVTLTNTPVLNLTNFQNQVTLSPSKSSGFYRLAIP